MRKGTRRLGECLISIITTAGYDLNRPCYEHYTYCKQILAGAVESESEFVYICEPDKEDNIYNPVVWRKSNPFWTENLLDIMTEEVKEAKAKQGVILRDFYVKSNNVWVQLSDNKYIDNAHWVACGGEQTLDDFRGKRLLHRA